MQDLIDHTIYSRLLAGKHSTEKVEVVASSKQINADGVVSSRLFSIVEPFEVPSAEESRALALVPDSNSGKFILVHTYNQTKNPEQLIYQIIYLPYANFSRTGGYLQPIVDMVNNPIPAYTPANQTVPALELENKSLTPEEQTILLENAFHEMLEGKFKFWMQLLDAIIQGAGIYIYNFPTNLEKQIQLIQCLILLIPLPARLYLSFTTNIKNLLAQSPRIAFGEAEKATQRTQLNWEEKRFLNQNAEMSDYVAYLAQNWGGNIRTLVDFVETMQPLAQQLEWENYGAEKLNILTKRHQTDKAIRNDAHQVLPDNLIKALNSELRPKDDLLLRYIERLLRYALNERDIKAMRTIKREMFDQPAIEEALAKIFVESLETQPDAVYSFARIYLQESIDEKWLGRLREAAEHSMKVALTDADPATLMSWLQLIAREPAEYQLADVLRKGIIAARSRAHEDPELANELIELAVKRDPALLGELLSDQEFLNTLPPITQQALQLKTDAIERIAEDSREIFLLALQLSKDQAKGKCVNANIIKLLWELYSAGSGHNLPREYRPLYLILSLTAEESGCLTQGAIELLLTLALANREDELFTKIAASFAKNGFLFPALPIAIQNSGRDPGEIPAIISNMQNAGIITRQERANTLIELLSAWDWRENTLPILEQLMRILQQHRDVQVPAAVLWKILEIAQADRQKSIARIATKRLLAEFKNTTGEAQLTENLQRLLELVQWSDNLHSIILHWWRNAVRAYSLTQLQRFEQLFEERRALGETRNIVQTTIALRTLLDGRTIEKFASEVNIAYKILEDFVDAFDPSSKQPGIIDQNVIRLEFSSRSNELSTDEQRILATNLKELAHLITSMARHRSKRTLIRNDETLERQIQTGKHQPESAIDMMKWLSGYLDGMQNEKQENE